jgi:hypothetical protein
MTRPSFRNSPNQPNQPSSSLGITLLFIGIILFVLILIFYMSTHSNLKICKKTLKNTSTVTNRPCPACEPCDMGIIKSFISGLGKQETINMSCPAGQSIALIEAKYTIVDTKENLDSNGKRMESDLTSLITHYTSNKQNFNENTRTFLNKVNLIFSPQEDLLENMTVPPGSFEDELPTRILYGNYICT